MNLAFISETTIAFDLDEGEMLGPFAGPSSGSFQAEDGNRLYEAAISSGHPIAPYAAPPAPVFTRIAKAEVWRRLTDEEAEAVDAALQAAPLRLRRVFEAAQFLDTTDADYPALRAGVVAAIGAARADEVLEPTY